MHENLYFDDTLTREALERSLAPDEGSGARPSLPQTAMNHSEIVSFVWGVADLG